MRGMEKWKAKYASHFSTPPTTATGHILCLPRYTNNPAVQNIGQATRSESVSKAAVSAHPSEPVAEVPVVATRSKGVCQY